MRSFNRLLVDVATACEKRANVYTETTCHSSWPWLKDNVYEQLAGQAAEVPSSEFRTVEYHRETGDLVDRILCALAKETLLKRGDEESVRIMLTLGYWEDLIESLSSGQHDVISAGFIETFASNPDLAEAAKSRVTSRTHCLAELQYYLPITIGQKLAHASLVFDQLLPHFQRDGLPSVSLLKFTVGVTRERLLPLTLETVILQYNLPRTDGRAGDAQAERLLLLEILANGGAEASHSHLAQLTCNQLKTQDPEIAEILIIWGKKHPANPQAVAAAIANMSRRESLDPLWKGICLMAKEYLAQWS